MSDFNYEKAYCTQALPAFNALNERQRKTHRSLCLLVKDLSQGRDLNIPISGNMEDIIDRARLSCKELAEISQASYFVGHWQPGLLQIPFDNKAGESWKVANVCDQILRRRLTTPHNVLIHEGKFRVTFSNKDCWLWNEFALATEKNLETFKNCNLSFGELTLEASAEKLAAVINDLWPDVDTMEGNEMYSNLLKLKKEKALKDLKEKQARDIAKLYQDIEDSKKKIKALEWLIEHDIHTDNVIYYSHAGRFCFGWRNKISEKEVPELSQKLIDFPFEYDIKH
jgi:hypothetical protein